MVRKNGWYQVYPEYDCWKALCVRFQNSWVQEVKWTRQAEADHYPKTDPKQLTDKQVFDIARIADAEKYGYLLDD